MPAVALLGPRQCGKSTLAKHVIGSYPSVYLDLERPSDLRKLTNPELFLEAHGDEVICLDEIQRVPELFPVLRSIIDVEGRSTRFLVLGSASRDLIRQSSESLAGRIAHLELSPFLVDEIPGSGPEELRRYWLRGGYPRSLLSRDDSGSFFWRTDFIKSFVERDVLQTKPGVSALTVERLMRMSAHVNGQVINYTKIGSSLGMSDNTVRNYFDLLHGAFVIRLLPPFHGNLKKRLIKSPKLYIRDTGLLHALLSIEEFDELLGHPDFGSSWESLVIENVVSHLGPTVSASFYRTAKGEEVDLVLQKGTKRMLVECKAGDAPGISKSLRVAIHDLVPEHSYIVSPVTESYPLDKGITIHSLHSVLRDERLQAFLRR